MQKSLSEWTTRRTLKVMDYSHRRPRWVALQLAESRKPKLQLRLAWRTGQYWKTFTWFDESQFLLQLSDCRIRIWDMNTSCLASKVQTGGGVIVWEIFLQPSERLSTSRASFNHHRLPEVLVVTVFIPLGSVHWSSDGCFQEDNTPIHNVQITSVFHNLAMSSLYWMTSNEAHLGWNEICLMDVQKLCNAFMSKRTNPVFNVCLIKCYLSRSTTFFFPPSSMALPIMYDKPTQEMDPKKEMHSCYS